MPTTVIVRTPRRVWSVRNAAAVTSREGGVDHVARPRRRHDAEFQLQHAILCGGLAGDRFIGRHQIGGVIALGRRQAGRSDDHPARGLFDAHRGDLVDQRAAIRFHGIPAAGLQAVNRTALEHTPVVRAVTGAASGSQDQCGQQAGGNRKSHHGSSSSRITVTPITQKGSD